jgi:hypothetical protein
MISINKFKGMMEVEMRVTNFGLKFIMLAKLEKKKNYLYFYVPNYRKVTINVYKSVGCYISDRPRKTDMKLTKSMKIEALSNIRLTYQPLSGKQSNKS